MKLVLLMYNMHPYFFPQKFGQIYAPYVAKYGNHCCFFSLATNKQHVETMQISCSLSKLTQFSIP